MKKIVISWFSALLFLIASFVLLSNHAFGVPPTGDASLNVTVVKGEGPSNIVLDGETFTGNYGNKLSLNLTTLEVEGKAFAFYIYNGEMVTNKNEEFVITNSSNLVIVLKEADEVVAAFVDTNGQLLDVKYNDGAFTPTFSGTTPTKPGYVFSGSFLGPVGNISSDTIYKASYNKSNNAAINVIVNGGEIDLESVTYNDIVTLTPNADAETFAYWADEDGQVVSSNPNYQFSALEDVELTAVFDNSYAAEPSIYLQDVTGIRTSYQSFLGYVDFDNYEYDLVEYGLLASNQEKVLFYGESGVSAIPSTILADTSEFLRSIPEETYATVRGYAIFKDSENNQVVKYSDNNFYVKEDLITQTYTETFASMTMSGTSYGNGSHTGVNGQLWSYTDARGDQTLNGKALLLRAGNLTTTFANGLTRLRFNYVRGFTNGDSRSFSIYINDVLINTITVPPSSDTVLSYDSGLLNYTGTVTLRIAGAGNQKIIDDIEWTQTTGQSVNTKLYGVEFNNEDNANVSSVRVNGTVAQPSSPTKAGYDFIGWKTITGSAYNFATPVTSHIKLFADFEINQYTISFNSNGGSAVSSITEDFESVVSAPSAPTQAGYTFVGWYSDAGLTQSYEFTTIPAQNITLYAKWTALEYTITFNTNGGNSISPITQAYESVLDLQIPVKDGFNFTGWFEDVDLEIPFESETMPLGNKTLYAGWVSASLTYDVEFNANGGTPAPSALHDVSGTVSAPTSMIKTGYSFDGWYISPTFEGSAWNFETDNVSADITLHAKWTVIIYTITYNLGGGTFASNPNPTTYTIESSLITISGTPTRGGFNFTSWSPASIAAGSTGNKTITAQWQTAQPVQIFTWTSTGRANLPSGWTQSGLDTDYAASNETALKFNSVGDKVTTATFTALTAQGTLTLRYYRSAAVGTQFVIKNQSGTVLHTVDVTSQSFANYTFTIPTGTTQLVFEMTIKGSGANLGLSQAHLVVNP